MFSVGNQIKLASVNGVSQGDDLEYSITMTSASPNVAIRHGLYATFMPKPINGVNGSGMQVHQSIMASDESENLFYEKGVKYEISDLGMHYLGGLLWRYPWGSSGSSDILT